MVTVRDGGSIRVGPAEGPPTIDLGDATLLPGFIDTHVHIDWHFNAEGPLPHAGPSRPSRTRSTPPRTPTCTLMAGFTTIQSVGSPRDKVLRDAIARGVLPGPRLLTSLGQISNPKLTPDEIRAEVRQEEGRGRRPGEDLRLGQHPRRRRADAVAGAARRGLRRAEGAGPPLDGPRAQPRVDDARRARRLHRGRARRPGHAEALQLLADRGVYFDPNIGLVTQNYLENKARFLGIGNYTEEGFASMEKALGLKDAMFSAALKTPGLKIVMGTDAVAGAHGQNIRERSSG